VTGNAALTAEKIKKLFIVNLGSTREKEDGKDEFTGVRWKKNLY
jgi:hypothetical protein